MAGDLFGCCEHVGEVCRAVFTGRRTYGDKEDQGFLDGMGKVCGKAQTAFFHIATHHSLETWFKDRDRTILQHLDLVCIFVYANDVIAHVCKAGTTGEAHIAGADYCEVHSFSPKKSL